ncbi:MAG: putative dehydrogenase [Candidatus Azotimanducaceae bacterium]|jgi:predicted dehydrogenase
MKIAIVGASGHGYTTIKGAKHYPDVTGDIVGIAPGSPGESISAITGYLEREGYQPGVFDHWQEMLVQCEPDIVVVNPHFFDHEQVALAVISAGRHLFVEKPLALTLRGFEKIRSAYQASSVELAAMLNMRYEPAMRTAWKAIQVGRIGEVRSLHVQKSYKLGTRPDFYKHRSTSGGLIPWVGCHGIDMIAFLSGKAFLNVNAASSAKNNRSHGDLETSASMFFRLSDEIIATAQVDYFRPESASGHDDDRARVVGTKGIIEVRHGKCLLLSDDDGLGDHGALDFAEHSEASAVELPLERPASLFADFMAQCAGVGVCDITAEESLENTRVSLLTRAAADTGQQVALSD